MAGPVKKAPRPHPPLHSIKHPLQHRWSVCKLRRGCEYSLFEYGIKPMWEDSRNQNEGRWLFSLNKSHRTTDLDNYWLEIASMRQDFPYIGSRCIVIAKNLPIPIYGQKEGRYVKS
ncbi:hypothetical protein MRX96_016958 [Rhipicephalus microplus]